MSKWDGSIYDDDDKGDITIIQSDNPIGCALGIFAFFAGIALCIWASNPC